MALSNKRTGRVTSGDVVALTGIGTRKMTPEEKEQHKKDFPGSRKENIDDRTIPTAPFFTYVEECIMERFFKQTLENDVEVLAMAWGKLCEIIVHNKLPNNYIFHSDKTLEHPEVPEWVGTPDGSKRRAALRRLPVFKADTITDIKCPLTRKSFFHLVRALYDFDGLKVRKKKKSEISGWDAIMYIRQNHKDGEKFYWQLVSNACIADAKFAELIVYMPYREELELIRKYNNDLAEPNWLVGRATDKELPFIYKQSGIKNINVIRFEVPQADKDFLTMRVKMAIELINKGETDTEKMKSLLIKIVEELNLAA